ncbi:siderophore-interacting protein [Agilicoccus flavus]|uniref:siderophore-interacting protein n=1 Tax=Agilicoccus flavus TaxID=2775968 RepID=UPI001CF63A00|nr:siderophore-interacting protein [Agilicoccus flavus]
MAPPSRKRPDRPARSVTVVGARRLTPDLVRVEFTGEDLVALGELEFTDHYVKLLFPPPGADYTWPFEPARIREQLPREQWPVTRTYTIRAFDRAARRMTIDFVVHGDAGLAGPWAAAAAPGDVMQFMGPGGGWGPDPAADVHLLVGDESAIPAVAAALDALPEGARALVHLEVRDAAGQVPLRDLPGLAVNWVHRGDAAYGRPLAAAVRAAGLPEGDVRAFVHGEAEMVRDLRRFLFVENGVPKDRVSISGYWRAGLNEDGWQSGKQEFMAGVEAEEARAARS